MAVSPSGRVTLLRLAQLRKALLLMDVTVLGRAAPVRLLQSLKALRLMASSPSANSTVFSSVQL